MSLLRQGKPLEAMQYLLKAAMMELREPYKAIMESRKAEKLLPYRKRGALDLISATKEGLSNVASSLQSLGLDFWAFKKSQDILFLDPYDPDAHLFPALLYTH